MEFTGSTASAYGNSLATKPIRMEWHQKDNSSHVLVPGQQPLALSVKLFDSVGRGSLVVGSEDFIELVICPSTGSSGVCTLSSANIPAINQRFNPLTGLSKIQAAVECAIGQIEMLFHVRVLGAEYIPKIVGRIACKHCDTGQRHVVHDDRGTWDCETCAPGTYSANHANLSASGFCFACPSSATCVNGANPIFGASKVTGAIEMEMPDESSGDYGTRKALAVKLEVDASKIVFLKPGQQRAENAAQNINFELFAETAQMAELIARLVAVGAVLGKTDIVSPPLAPGEVWEKVNGQHMLRYKRGKEPYCCMLQ